MQLLPMSSSLSLRSLCRVPRSTSRFIADSIILGTPISPCSKAEATSAKDQRSQPSTSPRDVTLDVLYHDDDVIVVNKPGNASLLSAVGSIKAARWESLVSQLRERFGQILPAHRLDAGTTGVLLFARTRRAGPCAASLLP